jgi:hypothetical protein
MTKAIGLVASQLPVYYLCRTDTAESPMGDSQLIVRRPQRERAAVIFGNVASYLCTTAVSACVKAGHMYRHPASVRTVKHVSLGAPFIHRGIRLRFVEPVEHLCAKWCLVMQGVTLHMIVSGKVSAKIDIHGRNVQLFHDATLLSMQVSYSSIAHISHLTNAID